MSASTPASRPQSDEMSRGSMRSTSMGDQIEGNIHIVDMPQWSAVLGCTKFAFSLFVLGFTAACTSVWGSYPALAFTLSTASLTLITFIYYIVALPHRPRLYNYHAVLVLEIVGTACWLISAILLAKWTHDFNNERWREDPQNSQFGSLPASALGVEAIRKEITRALHPGFGKSFNITTKLAGVSTGLAGLEFVLFLTTLIIFSKNLHQHRMDGYPSMYGQPMKTPGGTVRTTRKASVNTNHSGVSGGSAPDSMGEHSKEKSDPSLAAAIQTP